VAFDNRLFAFDFADAPAEVGDEFVDGGKLGFCWLIAIEVPNEADPKGDIVEVIAGNVPAVDLAGPAVANLDFAIARRVPVANDEVICEPVLHFANSPVIHVKDPGVPLPGSAVVNDDVFPPTALDPGLIDGLPDGRGEVSPALEKPGELRASWGFKSLVFIKPGFLDDNRRVKWSALGRLAFRNLNGSRRRCGCRGILGLRRWADWLGLLRGIRHFFRERNKIMRLVGGRF